MRCPACKTILQIVYPLTLCPLPFAPYPLPFTFLLSFFSALCLPYASQYANTLSELFFSASKFRVGQENGGNIVETALPLFVSVKGMI